MESHDIVLMQEEKEKKIRDIVKREFQKEISLKENEALKIEDEILKTKKLLQKLRYAIVSNYYKPGTDETQRQAQQSIKDNAIVASGIKEFDQKPIHPSLKKLIGKKPVNYSEILSTSRPRRKAAEDAISNINEKMNLVKPKKSETITKPVASLKSETEDLNVSQLTSSRGKNQIKHTLVVGNTSKYITEEPTSSITHKWMCYVKTKTSTPVDKMVKKVRFHLDLSYKPNDVIEVTSPPFHLTKRGYGEFVVKVLIFFKDEVGLKPVQVFHRLALDTELSGRQMLGNETVTELWTQDFLKESENAENLALMDHDYYKSQANSTEMQGNNKVNDT